jgi:hypothetical protein
MITAVVRFRLTRDDAKAMFEKSAYFLQVGVQPKLGYDLDWRDRQLLSSAHRLDARLRVAVFCRRGATNPARAAELRVQSPGFRASSDTISPRSPPMMAVSTRDFAAIDGNRRQLWTISIGMPARTRTGAVGDASLD